LNYEARSLRKLGPNCRLKYEGEAGPSEGAEGEEPVPAYPMNHRSREATHSRTERSRQRGNDKNTAYNVKAGITMRIVKNLKIFDVHRGMPNSKTIGTSIKFYLQSGGMPIKIFPRQYVTFYL
jgi:hypothetical protein